MLTTRMGCPLVTTKVMLPGSLYSIMFGVDAMIVLFTFMFNLGCSIVLQRFSRLFSGYAPRDSVQKVLFQLDT